jgi:putative ABC transport system permease protein
LGVVLGVAIILAVSISNRSALDSITTLFSEASGKAHLIVTTSASDEQGFDEAVLSRVALTEGIRVAVPSLQVQAFLADEAAPSELGISLFGASSGGMLLFGIHPTLDHEARHYALSDGRFLTADLNAYDLVVVDEYAHDKDLQVGDDVRLRTSQGVEIVRVVGLISKQGPGRLNNGAFGLLPIETAQELSGRLGSLDQIDVVATVETEDSAGLEQLKNRLQDRLGDAYSVTFPAAQGERVSQMLSGYRVGLQVFGYIALFVGAFLIYNAFWMTVVERTREIGMLRTVGMTQRQVMLQILAEAGLLGVCGSLLGIGAGLLLSRGLIRVMEALLAQEVKPVWVPASAVAISLVVGLGVTLVASAVPAWQAGRISPLEALRVRGTRRESWGAGRGWIAGAVLLAVSYLILFRVRLPAEFDWLRSAFILVLLLGGTLLIPLGVTAWERLARPWMVRLYGNEGQLGSRNTQRAKLRTTLTVAALFVSVAMILSVGAVSTTFVNDIGAWVQEYIGGDLFIHSPLPMRMDLAIRLGSIEGVRAVTPVRYVDVVWADAPAGAERLVFTAIDPVTYRQVTSMVFAAGQGDPDLMFGRLAEGDVVFVSAVLADKYGLAAGDTMRIKTRRGLRDLRVGAVVVDFYNRGLVIEGSRKDMRRYFGLNDVSAFMVRIEPGLNVAEVQARIDELYGGRRHLTIESNSALKGRAMALLAQTNSVFDVLALIATIVAALGIVNTLTMNVMERTQEIGMLRSVGMTRRQVGKMILAEAGMMGLVGAGFGLLGGLLLTATILRAINASTAYELPFVLPMRTIVACLFIALVVSQLAAVWPARRASDIPIVEAIQFE